MKVKVQRNKAPFEFEAVNENGNSITMTASPNIGGSGEGFRPMQLLVAGLGSCSSIDIILILQKQKQEVEDYWVELEAERREDETPAIFKTISVKYFLKGDLSPKKVDRAIKLSLEKYCSVSKILEPTCTITYDFEIL